MRRDGPRERGPDKYPAGAGSRTNTDTRVTRRQDPRDDTWSAEDRKKRTRNSSRSARSQSEGGGGSSFSYPNYSQRWEGLWWDEAE